MEENYDVLKKLQRQNVLRQTFYQCRSDIIFKLTNFTISVNSYTRSDI